MIDRNKHSYVFTFRLSEAKPDEYRALEVMRAWEHRGHKVRYIVTAALNALEGARIPDPPPPEQEGGVDMDKVKALLDNRLREFDQVVGRLNDIADDLAHADQRGYTNEKRQDLRNEAGEISQRYRRSLRAAVDFGEDE